VSKVLVLGASGMLGHSVYLKLKDSGLKVTGTQRMNLNSQDSELVDFEVDENFRDFLEENLPNYEYVVNCIGLIPHKFLSEASQNTMWAIKVNSVFPNVLAEIASKFDCKVLQIATDCVFSGQEGNYSEESLPDPSDIYGITKLCGEINMANVMNIRCSVIGLENKSAYSLLSWFLSQPQNAPVKGFTNHVWNGVTSLAFAKIVKGIIESDGFVAGTHHLVPGDFKTKYDLIKLFALYGDRLDLDVKPWDTGSLVDRSLSTVFPEVNNTLWEAAGYSRAPLIEAMIAEIFKEEKEKKSNE